MKLKIKVPKKTYTTSYITKLVRNTIKEELKYISIETSSILRNHTKQIETLINHFIIILERRIREEKMTAENNQEKKIEVKK